ncbi:MAG: hypothetical protein ABI844_00465 [Saprospiraceae bacterium]
MIHSSYKLVLFYILFPLLAWAGDGDFTKNYHKEYDVPVDAHIELINKYGYIKIHAWDKRIASIDVNILANTTNESRANEIFDKISVSFTTSSNYIKAETIINTNPGNKSWWDWKRWLGWDDNKSTYKINYDVNIPADLYLKLNLKYGDAFIEKMDRDAVLKISYGHLRLDELAADLDLDLAYSEGNMGNIKNGNINLRYSNIIMSNMGNGSLNFKYSDIKMKEGGDLKAECAYGELNAKHVKTLDIHSKYDDIQVESVDEIYVNSSYSDFDFGKINKRSSFTTTYGDIIIREISPGFENIDIKSAYTDIRISSHGQAYKLDADGNYADIKTTGDFNSTYLVEKSSSKSVKGYSRSENGSGLIRATLSYGGLRID